MKLTALTGYKRSTRDRYILSLRNRELVTIEGQEVRASEVLF